MDLTCDGYITSWTLGVNNSMNSMNTALIPQITTWRFQVFNGYMQQSITNESQPKIGTQRIEYTPSPPGVPVQAGDIVGIRLPSVDNNMLMIKPLFLRLSQGNSSTISCAGVQGDSETFFFDTANRRCNVGSEEEQSLYIPLISVIISKLPHCLHARINYITLTLPNDSFQILMYHHFLLRPLPPLLHQPPLPLPLHLRLLTQELLLKTLLQVC